MGRNVSAVPPTLTVASPLNTDSQMTISFPFNAGSAAWTTIISPGQLERELHPGYPGHGFQSMPAASLSVFTGLLSSVLAVLYSIIHKTNLTSSGLMKNG